MIRSVVSGLLLLFLLLIPAPAYGDAGAVGRMGDSVQPLEHTHVEMAKKDIKAKVTVRYTYFEAAFTFHNNGPDTTVLMGFPVASGEAAERMRLRDLEDFAVYVNGEAVPVKKEEGLMPETGRNNLDFPHWYIWEVDFSEGETKEVLNTYKAPNGSDGVAFISTGYIITTGSTWQGPIGKARITFDLQDFSPSRITFAVPPGYRFEDGKLIWEWENLEPLHNIEITIDHVSEMYLPGDVIETKEVWDDKLQSEKYDEVLAQAEQVLQDSDDHADEMNYLAKMYLGLAYEKMGNIQQAVTSWEALLEDYDLSLAASRRLPGDIYITNKIFYHLSSLYHLTERKSALIDLYHLLRDTQISAHLQRLVESYIPSDIIENSPPSINKVIIDNRKLLHIEAEDPDGDLAGIQFTLWKETDGEKTVISEQQLPAFSAYYSEFYFITPVYIDDNSYKFSGSYALEDIFPEIKDTEPGAEEADYFFVVEIYDFAGNKTSTGALKFDKELLTEKDQTEIPKDTVKEEPEETLADQGRDPGNRTIFWLALGISALVLLVALLYFIKKRHTHHKLNE